MSPSRIREEIREFIGVKLSHEFQEVDKHIYICIYI